MTIEGSNKRILNHLDKEMRFITMTMSDVIAYAIPFVLGTIFDSMFVIPFFGLIAVFIVKKFTRRFPRFYLLRSLYWNIPTVRFNKFLKVSFPPSHKRFWVK